MSATNGFQEAIKTPASLVAFLSKMKAFDKAFCDLMASGEDFNIRLEIRGMKGEVIHCRLSTDSTERPNGNQIKSAEERE